MSPVGEPGSGRGAETLKRGLRALVGCLGGNEPSQGCDDLKGGYRLRPRHFCVPRVGFVTLPTRAVHARA